MPAAGGRNGHQPCATVVYSGRLDEQANTALVASDPAAPCFVNEPAVANKVAL